MVECRLAALCLQKYKFNKIDLQNIPKLKTVQESYGVDLPSILNQLDFTFARNDKKAQEPFTRAEVLAKLEITDEELKSHILSSNTQEMDEFWLYKRAEHVFSEAFRVEQFARICNGEQGENVLTKLGTGHIVFVVVFKLIPARWLSANQISSLRAPANHKLLKSISMTSGLSRLFCDLTKV